MSNIDIIARQELTLALVNTVGIIAVRQQVLKQQRQDVRSWHCDVKKRVRADVSVHLATDTRVVYAVVDLVEGQRYICRKENTSADEHTQV